MELKPKSKERWWESRCWLCASSLCRLCGSVFLSYYVTVLPFVSFQNEIKPFSKGNWECSVVVQERVFGEIVWEGITIEWIPKCTEVLLRFHCQYSAAVKCFFALSSSVMCQKPKYQLFWLFGTWVSLILFQSNSSRLTEKSNFIKFKWKTLLWTDKIIWQFPQIVR